KVCIFFTRQDSGFDGFNCSVVGGRSVPEQFLGLGRSEALNDRLACVSHLKTMHRTSAKKLSRKLRLNHRATRRRIRLSLKKPRVAHLRPLRSSLPDAREGLKTLPVNGVNGHAKAEPRFLSDTALASAEQLVGTIKGQ